MDRTQQKWLTLKTMYEEASCKLDEQISDHEGLLKYLDLMTDDNERKASVDNQGDRSMITKVEKLSSEIKAFHAKTVEPLIQEMMFEELLGRVQKTYDSYNQSLQDIKM